MSAITRCATDFRPVTRPLHVRLAHSIDNHVDGVNWLHVAFKICAYSYITFIAWITWKVFPVSGHWDVGQQPNRAAISFQDLSNYFGSFNGFSECNIRALDLYSPPTRDGSENSDSAAFCPNRMALLRAMSDGGRIGFDTPYISKGCHYRWHTVEEICMILERFDGVVFVGDSTLQPIYSGLNILLRRDLANGALQTWDMSSDKKNDCHCNNQFTKPDCGQHFVTASEEVSESIREGHHGKRPSYRCKRTPHTFLKISAGKPAPSDVDTFNQIVPKAPRSNYKPVPIIHSLSPTTTTHKDASTSLLGFLKLADLSGRKTPMLWIGPTAAGHIEVKGRKTNQEIWDFDAVLERTAQEHDVEVLKMWNMTVQASSWDGVRFGENVALVQAMMVINWLSRL